MHRFLRATTALVAGTFLLALAASPVQGAGRSYVALGDSYSAGTGTRSYLRDGTSCRRSVFAYPSLIASSKGYLLNFRACAGATTADVQRSQLGALKKSTRYVTITIGGNDAGFARVLTECARPAWASNCNGAIARARSIINKQLPGRLRTLYSSISHRAPNARVVVVGYPRIFNGQDCNALTWFSRSEESRLNATADLLNAKIQAAASRAGFAFSDATSVFVGHAVCDHPEWLNGLSRPNGGSYHPNRLGHSSGYAPLVGAALTGSAVTVDQQTTQRAAASERRLTSQERPYAASDETIRPTEFTPPDLNSPEIKRAAARAGVDLGSRASINAMDKRYAAIQAQTDR